MTFKKAGLLFGAAVFIFAAAYLGVMMTRDPQVDISRYNNVVPEYKAKIKELRIGAKLASGYFFGLRQQEGVNRLEHLAADESPISAPAKKTLFYYYAEPERYGCEYIETCPLMHRHFTRERSEKAFYWARQMQGDDKTYALASLLRDTRVAPLATEADRIALMTETEDVNDAALKASAALGFHHLDKRYFKNDMIAAAALWLNRAEEIEQKL